MTLEEIKRVCEAATPGPWAPDLYFETRLDGSTITRASGPNLRDDRAQSESDAAFIAMARTVLPKLLKVAEAAKRARADLDDFYLKAKLEGGAYTIDDEWEGWFSRDEIDKALAALESTDV